MYHGDRRRARRARRYTTSYWFGQYGTYKVKDHGTLNKLDIYETLFLMDNGVLEVANIRQESR